MTKNKRTYFIRDLIREVRADILKKVDQMPDDWDGIELRRYIADKFEDAVIILARGHVRQYGNSKRLKAYHDAVISNNL